MKLTKEQIATLRDLADGGQTLVPARRAGFFIENGLGVRAGPSHRRAFTALAATQKGLDEAAKHRHRELMPTKDERIEQLGRAVGALRADLALMGLAWAIERQQLTGEPFGQLSARHFDLMAANGLDMTPYNRLPAAADSEGQTA